MLFGIPIWSRQNKDRLGEDFLAHDFLDIVARTIATEPAIRATCAALSLAIPNEWRAPQWHELVAEWTSAANGELTDSQA